ncbi:PREDICTED: isoamyl acetate-hydrolyzing esterase 1 homolog isoform X1 [Gavialis gangeticus]|uniref:isoamyl acetate-hydrolyzing esterase 1 homolog isoform X1 n=1 Tax=Gavialis gangeticus TaxID=94835 RepID=UPI00092EB175|nr:PREDICTED: isoamyl acetate-hydrolyzing esterase 1 homolog isoform X1 [Gavialis gangeticus]
MRHSSPGSSAGWAGQRGGAGQGVHHCAGAGGGGGQWLRGRQAGACRRGGAARRGWRRWARVAGCCRGPASSCSGTPSPRKCDVLNRGLSGYNTRWAKLVLPRLISKSSNAENTVAVTIFFGANDSTLKDVNPKQHVPLEEYAENLKSLVQYLKSVDITEDRIILITPPPLYEPAWEKECIAKGDKLNRLNSTTGEYAKTCVQVAKECGTDVIDLWTLMQRNKDFSSYLSDGLHLSAEGNNFLATQLWSWLENKISALPLLFPYWRDVDHLNPEGSLLGTPAH